jgi:hypothetical protein
VAASRDRPSDIGSFFYKVEGKFGARGIMISMNGYTDGVMKSLKVGKELRVLLLDGVHLSNVVFGLYSFAQLLEHAQCQASLKSSLYCTHGLDG